MGKGLSKCPHFQNARKYAHFQNAMKIRWKCVHFHENAHIFKKQVFWDRACFRVRVFSSKDPSGGSRGCRQRAPPLRAQILSFWHTNFSKRSRLGSWRPLRGRRPPTGNPGSATGPNYKLLFRVIVHLSTCILSEFLQIMRTWLVVFPAGAKLSDINFVAVTKTDSRMRPISSRKCY